MPIKVPAAESGYRQPREPKRTPASSINSTIRGINGIRKAGRRARLEKLFGRVEQDPLDIARREAEEARKLADEARARV